MTSLNHARQYKVIAGCDGNDRHGHRLNMLMGDIECAGAPKDTYEFLSFKTIGESMGLDVRVVTAKSFYGVCPRHEVQALSYEHVHRNIWWTLTKRGEILAARRKAKQ